MAESPTIESLQIQVEATATSAEQSIERLKSALNRLRSACAKGAGLTSYIEQLSQLKETTDKLGTSSSESLSKLATSLREVKSVGKLNLGETVSQLDKASTAAEKTASSTSNISKRLLTAVASLKVAGSAIARLIDKSNTYVEDLNLFNASLGEYAQSAQEYAESVSSLMGIDPAAWMRNQGIFMTLAKGFGVTSDRAYIMSKNLTQLGYDLSSFFNIASNSGQGSAMQKLQAAISGELEPLRRLGYDLSEARLKAVALSLGIDQTFDSMTQAQKAQLRYYAIMTQVTTAQGDMARTLNAPANQLRVLKAQAEQAARALGNIFIPALNAIQPYAIAVANAIQQVANAIANLFGFSLPEIDYSGISDTTSAVDGLDDSLTSAGGSAKKLNELLADFDELNIIQSQTGGGGGGGKNTLFNPDDWTFQLPEYDFLKDLVKSRAGDILTSWKPTITWITEHIEQLISLAEGMGAALLTWRIGKSFLGEDYLQASLKLGSLLTLATAFATAVGTIALDIKFTNDWLNNGDWGALGASLITPVVGATTAGKLVEKFLTGNAAAKSLGEFTKDATLIIDAGTRIDTTLDDITTKGFNERNVMSLLIGAGELGVGSYKLTSAIAKAILGENIGFGKKATVAAVVTAGIGLSIFLENKADMLDPTQDVGQWILDKAGSALSAGLAGFLAGKLILGFTAEQAMGMGAITLFLGSTISLVTELSDTVENKVTASQIRKKMWDTLVGVVESSIGLALGLKLVFGVSGGAAVAAGVGAAIALSVASYFILKANMIEVEAERNMKMQWGTEGLTEAQVQEKVNSYFNFDVTATVTQMTAVVTNKTKVKTSVSEGFKSLQTVLNSLKLGIDEEGSYQEIADILSGDGGLIAQINELMSQDINTIKLWLSLGDVDSKALAGLGDINSIIAADSAVAKDLEWAGKTFSDLITKGMKEELTDQEIEMRNALLDFISNVTEGAVRGRMEGEFAGGVTALHLKDMNMSSATSVIAKYQAMEQSLREDLESVQKETMASLYSQRAVIQADVDAYAELHPGQEIPPELTDGIAKLDVLIADLVKNWDKRLSDDFTAMTSSARQSLFEEMIELFDNDNLKRAIQNDITALADTTGRPLEEVLEHYLAGDWSEGGKGSLWNTLNNYSNGQITDWETLFGDMDMAEQWNDILSNILSRALGANDFNLAHNALVDTNEAAQAVAGFYESLDTYKEYMTDTAYTTLKTYIDTLSSYDPESDLYGSLHDYLAAVFEGWNLKTSGKTTEFLAGQDERTELLAQYKELLAETQEYTPFEHVGADFSSAMTTVRSDWNATIQSMNENNSVQIKITPRLAGFNFKWPEIFFRAGGGMPDVGELFVAREAGPEMVGKIGRNTAVANNDQIEAGISSGVREANTEQNELLRQQNQYLRLLVAKSGNVKLEPSTALARTVKRSNELLTTAGG